MTELQQREADLIEEFAFFSDWTQKYEYIIELGKDLPLLEEQFKIDDYRIKGCQSQVWLNASADGSKVVYKADSDAIITKGIVAMLIQIYSGIEAAEIVQHELNFLDKIGLKEHLSPTRSNGLVSMVKQMKLFALAIQQREQV